MFKINISSDIVNVKFLFYFLSSHKIQNYIASVAGKSTMPAIKFGDIEKIQILVPSLEEQERIVSILDKFDALVNDISDGLPAEINARRQQYEYYRDKLLSFPMVA
jgi:type I restriction enzyme S subunit